MVSVHPSMLETGPEAPRRLPDLTPFYRLVALETCGSTNDEARELARNGAPEGTLVWTRRQDYGRGRRGRTWSSPEGNLFMTVVLRPAVAPAAAAQVSFVAAVALAEAIGSLIPGVPRLKWPNDVLIDGAKTAGILLESEPGRAGTVDWLVLGIGVNVCHFPPDTEYRATSVAASGAPQVTVETMLERLADRLEVWYRRWSTQGFAPVRAAWLAAAHGLGGPVMVRLGDGAFTARFADLDADGALVAELESGATRRVTAGDVFFG
ncbi:MAG: biotin-[acetyl-CoA-carboxylase] ligase, birA [Pseudomonadota bacterium]|jgi:BirA family biotin operon repressor/biotin-[acetyl-CoA-carboxylase] ligase